MTFNWQEFAETLGGQAVFLAALAYLLKELVSSRLERDADAFRAELKRNADIEIERLKSNLQIAALEHQIRFSKLHEQRATLISQLSKEIAEVPAVVANYVIHNVKDNESLSLAINRSVGLYSLIQTNRVLLPTSLCTLLDEFANKLTKIVTFVSVYWTRFPENEYARPEYRAEQNKVMREAASAFENELPELRRKIEEELRTLLAGQISETRAG
jgi:DNA anti-recombination protein RmuC